MKKRIGIASVLAVVMVLGICAPVLAWDKEDTEVANNADFIVGTGVDVDAPSVETHLGGDGYNLYRDDTTGTGNLDIVVITTFTPNRIDLPSGFFIWKTGASPNTWYWATAPRGYDRDPVAYLTVVLPDGKIRVELNGTKHSAIDFSDGTWRIQIPAEVRIWRDTGGASTKLFVLDDGTIKAGVHFAGGEVVVTRID